MDNLTIGKRLVELCNNGNGEQAVAELYAADIVSIEGAEGEDMPARMEGIDAVNQKGQWWYANNEVHGVTAEGPFVGLEPDQFAVRFHLDVTPKGGERQQMTEIGLYRTRDGKVAEERFLFQA